MPKKEELISKYHGCLKCGGIEIDFDYFGQYYFINYIASKCAYCTKRNEV